MRTDDLDYPLLPESIAQEPAEPRDSARLLVAERESVSHRLVSDAASLLRPGDVVVLNDTRVLRARVPVRRSSGGTGEVLLLEEAGDGWWEALVRPSRKIGPGEIVVAQSGELEFEVGADLGEGRRLVRPNVERLLDALEGAGQMPLPPYITTPVTDDDRYQTVYAQRPASAAAPTAGLHLTPELIEAMRATGAMVCRVELVVGLGTFRPITVERVEDHVMHAERYRVPAETMAAVGEASRVVAVGTTTVRALESAATTGRLEGSTDIFITPGYQWKAVDVLMTNFHLPRSSLLAMVEAFCGPRWRELYREAAAEGYRFLSFGDAMWLERLPVVDA